MSALTRSNPLYDEPVLDPGMFARAPVMRDWAGAWEASFNQQQLAANALAREAALRQVELDNIDRIRQAGGTPPKTLDIGLIAVAYGTNSTLYSDYYRAWTEGDEDTARQILGDRETEIAKLQQQYPNAGILTYQQMTQQVKDVALRAERRYQSADFVGTGANVGGMFGGMIAAFDPQSSPLVFGSLATGPIGVGRAALARIAAQAGIGAAVEAANQFTGARATRQGLGLPTNTFWEIATSAAGAGIFQGIGEVGVAGARRLLGRRAPGAAGPPPPPGGPAAPGAPGAPGAPSGPIYGPPRPLPPPTPLPGAGAVPGPPTRAPYVLATPPGPPAGAAPGPPGAAAAAPPVAPGAAAAPAPAPGPPPDPNTISPGYQGVPAMSSGVDGYGQRTRKEPVPTVAVDPAFQPDRAGAEAFADSLAQAARSRPAGTAVSLDEIARELGYTSLEQRQEFAFRLYNLANNLDVADARGLELSPASRGSGLGNTFNVRDPNGVIRNYNTVYARTPAAAPTPSPAVAVTPSRPIPDSPLQLTPVGRARAREDLDIAGRQMEDWGGPLPGNITPVSDTAPVSTAGVLSNQWTDMPGLRAATPGDTLEQVAREIDPEAFRLWDRLAQSKADLTAQLDAAGAARLPEVEKELADVLDEIRRLRVESGRNRAAIAANAPRMQELEARRAALYGQLSEGDTVAMAGTRAQLARLDEQMRDLSPAVSRAYGRARGRWDGYERDRAQLQAALRDDKPSASVAYPYARILDDVELEPTVNPTVATHSDLVPELRGVERKPGEDDLATLARVEKERLATGVDDEALKQTEAMVSKVAADVDKAIKEIEIPGSDIKIRLDLDTITVPRGVDGFEEITMRQYLKEVDDEVQVAGAINSCLI